MSDEKQEAKQDRRNEKRVTIKNVGGGTHIFGAAFAHPRHPDELVAANGTAHKNPHAGKEDRSQAPAQLFSTETLHPGGEVKMTTDQVDLYDDEAFRKNVETRQFIVLLDGKDVRPDLAARDPKPRAAASTPATESAASAESSVLADILAKEDPKPVEG